MDLDNNAHSVFLLHYHLVLVVKYRRQVFDDAISGRAKEIFAYIAPNYNITLEEWNHDKDHVHILFKAHPNTEISKFINAYKSASSRLLKKEFPQIKKKLWKEHFWSQEIWQNVTACTTHSVSLVWHSPTHCLVSFTPWHTKQAQHSLITALT